MRETPGSWILFRPFWGVLAVFLGWCQWANAQLAAGAVVKSIAVPATVHLLKAHGIENFYQLSDRVFSGSAPEGEAAFAELKALGIRTIITVDGAKPDVDGARKFGLRYVHLPFGYDGVPTNQAVRLVKAAETLPGPVFVHCHHGLHRGPAGAAVICKGIEGWSASEAEAWMQLAGTATNYAGLYQSVAKFQPPTADALQSVGGDLPEKSAISALADVMVQIDGRFEHLKLLQRAGYAKPPEHPELEVAQEALLLDELFKELLRDPATKKHGAEFQAKLNQTEQAVAALRAKLAVAPVVIAEIDPVFKRLTESCAACHKAHRN